MMLIVDRLGPGFAVCELPDGSMHEVPLGELPQGIREGDCLRQQDGRYEIDADETDRRRRANRALFERLRRPEE